MKKYMILLLVVFVFLLSGCGTVAVSLVNESGYDDVECAIYNTISGTNNPAMLDNGQSISENGIKGQDIIITVKKDTSPWKVTVRKVYVSAPVHWGTNTYNFAVKPDGTIVAK